MKRGSMAELVRKLPLLSHKHLSVRTVKRGDWDGKKKEDNGASFL